MRSRNGLFLVTCLGIAAGLLWSYAQFVSYFGENGEDRFAVESVSRKLREERYRRELSEARLRDLGQEVAAVLPSAAHQRLASQGYELRTLASVVREPAAVKLDLSGVRMERAKRLFSLQKYAEASREFEDLLSDFPSSPNSVEAYFLLGESSYLQRDEKKAVEIADLMVTQFPEHELTGFILLRLGQINERNNRVEEAAEVYRTVEKSFGNPALIEQARRLAKALE